jgi:hypothetical protein
LERGYKKVTAAGATVAPSDRLLSGRCAGATVAGGREAGRPPARRVTLRLSEDMYVELVRRFGVKGLSRGVEMLLSEALSRPQVQRPAPQPPPQRPARPQEEGATEAQLALIAAVLERNRWSWPDVKDVLEFAVGAPLPDDPSALPKGLASKVISTLLSWEERPTREEVRRAKELMARMPAEVLDSLNLPERVADVKRYHIALVERAWARLELERARRGGGR